MGAGQARRVALCCILLLTGCAGIERAPQRDPPPAAATTSFEPKGAAPATPHAATKAGHDAITASAAVPAAASVPAGKGASAPVAAPSKAQAQAASTPTPAAHAPQSVTPPAAAARPVASPPLDLKSLETRLKETKAIGVFTKITLKNQVDDLLGQFRAFYQGRLKTSLAELRQSYDRLVLKVLALLQDADQSLATAIASSRESIWGILSDPAKFAAV